MMLKYITLFLAISCSLAAGENLLRENDWKLSPPTQVKRLPDGVFQLNAPDANSPVFMKQEVILNQTAVQPITFGADFKNLENDYPRRESTHGVYMNLTLDDGKVIPCVVVAPDPQRRDWETLRRTYTPPRPVKKVNFVVSFEKRSGVAQFKNIFMEVEKPLTSEGMRSHGIGVASSELRHCIAGLDAKGRPFVLAAPLDSGVRNYLLYTELDTGKTFQYFLPVDGGFISGAVLTDQGKYICGLSGKVVIFDINNREARLGDASAPGITWSAAIGNDGTVYLGNTPATLFSVDPVAGTVKDCGRVDPEETQLYWIAIDKESWVYCGTGVARAGVVAYQPKTGEKRQLIPEKDRVTGSGFVMRDEDGEVYISSPSGFAAKCLGGKIVTEKAARPAEVPVKHLKYGSRFFGIDADCKVVRYDMNKREIVWSDHGKQKKITFDYVSGGLNLTSAATGPDGLVYFSSAHPHHLCSFDPASGKKLDLGYNPVVGGGNFCNMAAAGGKFYTCEYAHGRMWEFDPAKPVSYSASEFFGILPENLIVSSRIDHGETALPGEILLCMAKSDDAVFRFFAPVEKDGKYYLNIRFYTFPTYGTVTMKAGKETLTRDLCGNEGRTQIFTFGPFELSPGQFPVEFTVKKSPQGKYPWFGITGFELAVAPRQDAELNPRILGQWSKAVMRPRMIAIHPNGNEVVMGGFSYDGMSGGQFGIHHLETGENRTIEKWLPGESCTAAVFSPEGDLLGGTSIDAIGGHVAAKEASVFKLDWRVGNVAKNLRLPGVRNVIAVSLWHGRLLAAADNGILYVINPAELEIERQYPIGAPVRNALLRTEDDRMFLLQGSQIAELDGVTFRPEQLARPLGAITGGGAALAGRLYFIVNSAEFHEYAIPPKKK